MIKKIILLLPLFFASIGHPSTPQPFFIYTNGASTSKAVVVNPFNSSDSRSLFEQMCFDMPKVFEYAHKNSLPVVFFVPRSLTGLSPLDANAEEIEGIRVGLAWASMFSRFADLGKTDVRVIEADNKLTQQTVLPAVEEILGHTFESKKNSPVILQPFTSLNTLLKKSPDQKTFLEPLTFLPEQPTRTTLKPTLPSTGHNKKRFLITGAAGFLGSHLTKALLDGGHQVICLDNFSCCSRENIEPFMSNPDFCFFQQDITDPIEVEGNIDYVIHLASIPSPVFYYRLPKETMRTGIHGTRNMLELAVKKNAQFFFSSTSEVYGDPAVTPQEENYAGNVSTVGMRSQYDQSKRGAETLIKIYFEQYGIDVRIARIFNTYGPHMQLQDGRVVTNFIGALLRHEPMTVYGDGMQTRSFAYVDDTIQGLLKLIHVSLAPQTPIKERVVNIGNDHELTIIELASCLNTLAPSFELQPAIINRVPQIDTTDPKQRNPNLQRARGLLGYEPRVTLMEGLEKTLSYFCKKGIKSF
jgi:UDP-glucuronate decarboxylase